LYRGSEINIFFLNYLIFIIKSFHLLSIPLIFYVIHLHMNILQKQILPLFTKKSHQVRNNTHTAFTLVELIVVISVLAVLATIAMTQIGNITS